MLELHLCTKPKEFIYKNTSIFFLNIVCIMNYIVGTFITIAKGGQMRKFLLGTTFIFSTVILTVFAQENLLTVEQSTIEEEIKLDTSRAKFAFSKKSKDILASLVGKSLTSSLGSDILPNGVTRHHDFILTVLTADSDLGLYTIRLQTFFLPPPATPDVDIFVIGRVGEDYIGRGSIPGKGAQEIFIKKVKNHLEVTLSDIYEHLFGTPIVAQQRAIFPLHHK